LIPPKWNNPGGIVPGAGQTAVSAQDLCDAQNGRKFVYLYGRVAYYDIFPGTREHVTRYCWLILSTGNPLTFQPNDPAHTLTFTFVTHPEGNGADEDIGGSSVSLANPQAI
jgi:hypothetical protein